MAQQGLSDARSAALHYEESDSYYRMEFDRINKENALLKQRLDALTSDNRALKRSIYHLSIGTPPASLGAHDLRFGRTEGVDEVTETDAVNDRELERNEMDKEIGGGSGITFVARMDMRHNAAVYAVKFSPGGELLASTSFDRSLRIWKTTDKYMSDEDEAPFVIKDAHGSNAVAVSWTMDAKVVLTGGFDGTVAEWAVDAGEYQEATRFSTRGLVYNLSVSPMDDRLFYVATSRKAVHFFDRRCDAGRDIASTVLFENDTVVNSIHVQIDGMRFITGDHGGAIKTWDARMVIQRDDAEEPIPIDTTYNDEHRRPITHVHTSPPAVGDDHGRFLAVNSYDNFVRVYDRGSFLFGDKNAELKPLHSMHGPLIRNWPIKSSFFVGADYNPMQAAGAFRRKRNIRGTIDREKLALDSMDEFELEKNLGDSDDNASVSSQRSRHAKQVNWGEKRRGGMLNSSLTLATGSADARIYMYDVGGPPGTSSLIQVLAGHRGHTDRVYAVDFHPSEPILASCSADSLVKIWAPVKTMIS